MLAIPDPGTIFSGLYLPTYFGNAFLWENSTPLILGQANNPYSIHLVDFDSISGGDGKINGGLTGAGKSVNPGNQEILILDNTGVPVKFLFSQADGSFTFDGLPYGEYWVYPVITGLHTIPVNVVLNENNKTATVFMKITGQSVAGTNETRLPELIANLYPNPASDQIVVTVKNKGTFTIHILDSGGKLVFAENISAAADGSALTLPLHGLKSGLYLLVIRSDEGFYSTRQFVKQ
jgi:hypothetical protein